MRIYTLGTSKRSPEEFREILKKYKIEVIFDVRRFPTSQFAHFQKGNLKKICEDNGIEYCHLGEELGGYRKGGYQEYTKTKEFKSGLEKIKVKAKDKITCILCAEKFPFRCHRRFITQELEKEGIEIIHILEVDKTIPKMAFAIGLGGAGENVVKILRKNFSE